MATATIINFKCIPSERDELKARAKAAGLTLSAWVRFALGLPPRAKRGRPKTGRKPASERKRNDTVHRGVGKGNYPRVRKPKMVQEPLFSETPPASAPSSAPSLTSTAPSSESTSAA